jgi:cell wall-associated NlpC family hydrolase
MTTLPFIDTFLRVGQGLAGVDEEDLMFDDSQSTLDPWNEDWFVGRSIRAQQPARNERKFAPTDDDPGHAKADERAMAAGTDLRRADLISIGRSQLGAPYIWADANPVGPAGGLGSGFDCSGYTQWVLSRFGIQTEHLAEAQQNQFRRVGRDQLRPGDLVYFNYGRKAAGVADHVGLYIGGGKMLAASSGAGEVTEQAVDWSRFIGGGATGIAAKPGGRAPRRSRGGRAGTRGAPPLTLVNTNLSDPPAFGAMMAALSQPADDLVARGEPTTRDLVYRDGGGPIKSQLRQGFLDAGRPDLAKMVGTRDFETWIRAESGWQPDVVSKVYPNHGRNYGLFQFWEGHSWTSNFVTDGRWTASPYKQAQLVARYFPHLTASAIHSYAQQVRDGEYKGWG